ncbi:hypothetical protein M2158_005725 [Streptomyces sp. SAI-144]|uniref:hypothetical protein n=1 Tax=unclassified Streptomyces TaxID=2593676 RepID=UPI0024744A38|nr:MULTISPECIES: hypothetical protein [unclassified Streptomyces]MDH6437184.1 hypothetical protein [Streptomyces sp. SAI-144]MDH6484609.1 hypothetical protein [Streptomyces sp. SAI-127]
MGTSPTPEFWRLFAVLLVISTAVTFVLSAALDALTLRAQRRDIGHRPTTTRMSEASHGPVRSLVRH